MKSLSLQCLFSTVLSRSYRTWKGGWLAASFQLLLSPEGLWQDTVVENPHCKSGGGLQS